MVDIKREFLTTDYGQMHVRTAGEHKAESVPLLCLHMAPQSGQDFEAFMKLAGKTRFVIAPDYHGYGDSDPLPTGSVTIEAYAKSIWQALGALKLKQLEILGHHTGSKVAIEMALQHPRKVKKLFCIALSTLTPEQYASINPVFAPLSSAPSGDGLSKWWNTLQAYYDPDTPYEVLAQKYAISVKSGPQFHLGFQASHEYNAEILNKLKTLSTPMTLINPNDDLKDVTPLAVKYIEDAILIDEPEWRPGFLDVNPQAVLDTLEAAIEQLDEHNGAAATLRAS